jgi:hypothetical protein
MNKNRHTGRIGLFIALGILVVILLALIHPETLIYPNQTESIYFHSPDTILMESTSGSVPSAGTPSSTPVGSFTPTLEEAPRPSQTPTTPRSSIPGRLAFVADLEGYPALYTINSDGSGFTKVFDNLSGISSPSWSPDGSQIAFFATARENNHFDIFLINADGSGLVNLTKTGDVEEMYPAWSPDSLQLAFMSSSISGPGSELMVMDRDGTNRVQLTENGAWQSSPSWSPDGPRLVFDSQMGDLPGIYEWDMGSSSLTRLTSSPLVAARPAWSPDGKKITFEASPDGSGIDDIYVMNSEGSQPVNLTDSLHPDSYPAWSPDGKSIAYVSSAVSDQSTIEVVNVAGKSTMTIFELAAPIRDLAWGIAPNLPATPTPVGSLTPTTTAVPASPQDPQKAEVALVAYFEALHSGDYNQAVQLYGGSYEQLIVFNTSMDPHDHAGLFAYACQGLLRCLLPGTIQLKESTTDTYTFMVEFRNEDGSTFVLGPCCGADATQQPPQSQFIYTVTRSRDGQFLVMDLPVYVP